MSTTRIEARRLAHRQVRPHVPLRRPAGLRAGRRPPPLGRRAAATGVSEVELALDALLADDGPGLPVPAVRQLRRGQPRRGPEHAGPPERRSRDCRTAAPTSARSATASFPTFLLSHWGVQRPDGAAPGRVARGAPDPSHRPHGRLHRPGCPRPGLEGRPERDRPRPLGPAPPARSTGTSRPAVSASSRRPTATATRSSPGWRSSATAGRPATSPAGSFAAPAEPVSRGWPARHAGPRSRRPHCCPGASRRVASRRRSRPG